MDDSSELSAYTDSEMERPYLTREVTKTLRVELQRRLQECGWRKKIRDMIRALLDDRGVNKVSYEDIAAEIVPKARMLVPSRVLRDMHEAMRSLMEPKAK
ncbi:enhancer of yellow 2b transcription factor-like [Drosophila mojavensis]|uniref:enhancer of yellow 2b transcription factor-like n=1 Tax=Drosophila mojavensis TaxID=7230 RepID=UPI001CD046FB|nr:enhancer of yellow 2b transcription factor-like [Drosophila mojavensis]